MKIIKNKWTTILESYSPIKMIPNDFKQYQLPEYIEAGSSPSQDIWKLATVQTPNLNENEILLKILFVSVDPYMRAKMTKQTIGFGEYQLNTFVPTFGIGIVVDSKNENVKSISNQSSHFSW
jgi:NADPH-dependent curcumin reductase CurA